MISSDLAPRGADLARIETRRSELVAGLVRSDPALIAPRISRLFLRFPSVRLESPAATMAAYAQDLSEFPLWAIESAIIALLKGHGLPSREFAPSSVAVRDAVVREVAKVEAELVAIDRVLRAKPKPPMAPDADRKAKAIAEARKFVGGGRPEQDGPKRGGMTPEELDEARAVCATLPKLSPYLRAKYRLPDAAPSQSEDAA